MTGVLIPGGHSGEGLVRLNELAGKRYYDFYEPVSRRGHPQNLGPATALYEAMSMDNVIYHAKCDITDPMAYEDLQQYVPPYQSIMMFEDAPTQPWIASMRSDMGSMGIAELEKTIATVQDTASGLESELKEAKRKVGHASYKDEQENLKYIVSDLEEQETQITELLADLTSKLNSLK
eukprot:CAMPEP_0169063554 /NCGR_PEP_ID=MMETSP1015-20121227/1350_1 /TAXON_ID=342587 /ORGANISM="Karlodinium micrum, Strain CCMP2283" /LENGTH=177 /DNA_ID=CAMNT_0009121905 /DNA_START=75 /DNA_END=608 /DNA_ORIENTATION=-